MSKRPVIVSDVNADTTKAGEAGAKLLIAKIFSALNESAITRDELAKHLGVTVGALSQWRSGQATPTLRHLVAALEYLGFRVVPVPAGSGVDLRRISKRSVIIPELKPTRRRRETLGRSC